MKSILFGALFLLAGSAAYAGCVGVQPDLTQICSMITDQAQCTQLAGVCQWQGGSMGTPTGSCSGDMPMCSMMTDQNQCTAMGCTWH